MQVYILLLISLIAGASAIYPDNHWSFSTKLSESNFDQTVKNSGIYLSIYL
jgi:hypothetical protein